MMSTTAERTNRAARKYYTVWHSPYSSETQEFETFMEEQKEQEQQETFRRTERTAENRGIIVRVGYAKEWTSTTRICENRGINPRRRYAYSVYADEWKTVNSVFTSIEDLLDHIMYYQVNKGE